MASLPSMPMRDRLCARIIKLAAGLQHGSRNLPYLDSCFDISRQAVVMISPSLSLM
jgi:hypothetical protein